MCTFSIILCEYLKHIQCCMFHLISRLQLYTRGHNPTSSPPSLPSPLGLSRQSSTAVRRHGANQDQLSGLPQQLEYIRWVQMRRDHLWEARERSRNLELQCTSSGKLAQNLRFWCGVWLGRRIVRELRKSRWGVGWWSMGSLAGFTRARPDFPGVIEFPEAFIDERTRSMCCATWAVGESLQ